MTLIRQNLPSPHDPLTVAIIVPAGAQLLGLIGMLEALNTANRVLHARAKPPLYDVQIVGVGGSTPTATGLPVTTRPSTEIASAHTLVVGGMLELADGTIEPGLLAEVERLAGGSARQVGVCMGSFVLGELGLLDDRACTSHWLGLRAMRARFPAARVQDDVLYTQDGTLFTSAGSSAGIDLALHLIRLDAGPSLALAVARLLVVFAHRSGGQSQFSTALRLRPTRDQRLRTLIDTVVERPADDHRVDTLAASVHMSPRHFARVFRDETGETPAQFVRRVRVETAERALAGTDASLDEIADDCGFSSADTLRRAFHRVTGVTPSTWRQRFAAHR